MKRIPYFILFVFINLCIIYSFTLINDKKDCYSKFELPGTEKIDSNLYMDKTEISNFHYLEYLYWTINVFGDTSQIYISALPKEELWNRENNYLIEFQYNYFRHHIFRDYPVVCITHEQAEKFCKWRSDRVFEYFLIKNRIIETNYAKNKDNYFTVEKYFSGQYFGLKPDKNIKKYPNYRLPTKEEWIRAKKYFDEKNDERLNSIFSTKKSNQIVYNVKLDTIPLPKDKKIKERRLAYRSILHDLKNDLFIIEPTKDVINLNMSGNVSEWLFEKNFIIGGNWKDTSSQYFENIKFANEAAVTIGFRCVAEYKEYK